ncbi:hypothetical protein [Amycolatopsis magusensis]|uniref:hypothetical protein n=1 Tax=Amycolatopsis magusensis TaxID=882444 RepID=UPI0024A9A522|nr:hypothetical protein [Amycolatopsis magusensis]MDI5979903.1 hypothetical protein [Amycolatopsis magusensis]
MVLNDFLESRAVDSKLARLSSEVDQYGLYPAASVVRSGWCRKAGVQSIGPTFNCATVLKDADAIDMINSEAFAEVDYLDSAGLNVFDPDSHPVNRCP